MESALSLAWSAFVAPGIAQAFTFAELPASQSDWGNHQIRFSELPQGNRFIHAVLLKRKAHSKLQV